MTHAAFDTLKFVEKLKQAGMPEPQARAFCEVQNEFFSQTIDSELVKQVDLVRTESSLRQAIADLKTELKQDIANLRAELKQDIADLRAEFNETRSTQRLLQWMMGFLLAGVASLVIKAFF